MLSKKSAFGRKYSILGARLNWLLALSEALPVEGQASKVLISNPYGKEGLVLETRPGCAIWNASASIDTSGYLVLTNVYGYSSWRLHYLLAALKNGIVEDFPDRSLNHICFYTACANPYHIEVITEKENLAYRKVNYYRADINDGASVPFGKGISLDGSLWEAGENFQTDLATGHGCGAYPAIARLLEKWYYCESDKLGEKDFNEYLTTLLQSTKGCEVDFSRDKVISHKGIKSYLYGELLFAYLYINELVDKDVTELELIKKDWLYVLQADGRLYTKF